MSKDPAQTRIKRFDEIDTDSDFDVSQKASNSKQRKVNANPRDTISLGSLHDSTDDDSIVFDALTDRRSQNPTPSQALQESHSLPKASPGVSAVPPHSSPTVAALPEHSPAVPAAAPSPQSSLGAASAPSHRSPVLPTVPPQPTPAFSVPLPQPSPAAAASTAPPQRSQTAMAAAPHQSSPAVSAAPSQPSPVLSTVPPQPSPAVPAAVPPPQPSPLVSVAAPQSTVAADALLSLHAGPLHPADDDFGACADETPMAQRFASSAATPRSTEQKKANQSVLFRAKQRLEQKRRMEVLGTPQRRDPSMSRSPERFLGKSPGMMSIGSHHPSSVPAQTEGVLRRLAAENHRLHEEIAFLSRENSRYRSAQSSIDTTDQMKLRISVDLLQKELFEKEEQQVSALNKLTSERDGMLLQLQEAIEQSEGYMAAASQYEKLYNEKVKDLQSLTSKYQLLVQESDLSVNKRRTLEQSYGERLQIEVSKAEKYKDLLLDAKEQRSHLQQLVAQLQQEVDHIAQQNRELQEGTTNSNTLLRKCKADYEDKVAMLQRDAEIMKDTIAQKTSSHAAELREERRMYDALKQSQKTYMMQCKSDTDHLRKTIEDIHEESKVALREERQKRLDAEAKVQRLEMTQSRMTKEPSNSESEDLEERLRSSRETLSGARLDRDNALRALQKLKDECSLHKDTIACYQGEIQMLNAELLASEEARGDSERQNKVLTATVQELLENDESQAAQLDELQQELMIMKESNNFPQKHSPEAQLLVSENERLTEECERLTEERSRLIEENGKIAGELLNWKNEVRNFAVTYKSRIASP